MFVSQGEHQLGCNICQNQVEVSFYVCQTTFAGFLSDSEQCHVKPNTKKVENSTQGGPYYSEARTCASYIVREVLVGERENTT